MAQRGAKPRDRAAEIAEAAAAVSNIVPMTTTGDKERRRVQAISALSYRLAGLTFAQIAERIDVSPTQASLLVRDALSEGIPAESVEEKRDLENARLDRLQAAIWAKALDGEYEAIDRYLKISQERSRLNGMYAPTAIRMRVEVRQEMEQALEQLQVLVLQEGVKHGDLGLD
jgi:hypothetical protein